MNQPNKVKTRVTIDEAFLKKGSTLNANAFAAGWNAALDSVILPEGKRFEVGDSCLVYRHDKEKWVDAVIGAAERDDEMWIIPEDVRVAPQTRELTGEEKLEAVRQKSGMSDAELLGLFIQMESSGQDTLEQLCFDYGIPKMREV